MRIYEGTLRGSRVHSDVPGVAYLGAILVVDAHGLDGAPYVPPVEHRRVLVALLDAPKPDDWLDVDHDFTIGEDGSVTVRDVANANGDGPRVAELSPATARALVLAYLRRF